MSNGNTAPLSKDQTVRAHPLSRLEQIEGRWLLMRVGERIGYHVDSLTAAILVRAASPVSIEMFSAALSNYGVERIRQTIDLLIKTEFLVSTERLDYQALTEELAEWTAAGWEAAAQYHFQTYGYEFERYEKDGTSYEDARRMKCYAAEQPDTDRSKTYDTAALETRALQIPNPELAPELADGSNIQKSRLSAENLTELLSLLSCPVQQKKLPWAGADLALRKTSPSGGSRHPTEVYFFVNGIDGLIDGWWHIASRECQIERITQSDQSIKIDKLLCDQSFFNARVLVLYTCVFARNRYRYREPRTFRTVHMDVGHLMGTLEYMAASRGLIAKSITKINMDAFAKALALDTLVECPIAATVLLEEPIL